MMLREIFKVLERLFCGYVRVFLGLIILNFFNLFYFLVDFL